MRDIEQGRGKIQREANFTRLLRPAGDARNYFNAQLDDYGDAFQHRAPVSLRVKAAFSHDTPDLRGTAGFGFWNAPFAPGSWRLRFPKTAWFFFGSPPLNLPLALDVPGSGFKAATMDATHLPFFMLLPAAPLGFLLTRIKPLYRPLWRIGQRAIRVSEKALDLDMTARHIYQIDWLRGHVDFRVDGNLVHSSPYSPTGRMGVVIWIDNQYAIVTPQGRFGWGLVECSGPQWLDILELEISVPNAAGLTK